MQKKKKKKKKKEQNAVMHTFLDNATQIRNEQIMHVLRKYIHLRLQRPN